jgi:hypothetical protein
MRREGPPCPCRPRRRRAGEVARQLGPGGGSARRCTGGCLALGAHRGLVTPSRRPQGELQGNPGHGKAQHDRPSEADRPCRRKAGARAPGLRGGLRPGPTRPAPPNAEEPGTSPSWTGPGWGPAGARAGRRADPDSQRVGSGVPRQRVAAEGLKKRRPRTACDSFELISSMVKISTATTVQQIKFNKGGGPANRTKEGRENVARPPAARERSLNPAADHIRAASPYWTAPRPRPRDPHRVQATRGDKVDRPDPCGPSVTRTGRASAVQPPGLLFSDVPPRPSTRSTNPPVATGGWI